MTAQSFIDLEREEACWDHGKLTPCPKCIADAEWLMQMHEAEAFERAAALTDSLVFSLPSDREHAKKHGDYLRKRASDIRGALQREADREANAAEDAAKW